LLNSRVAKLHHLSAVGADDMVVLFVAVRLLKLGQVLPELMFFHQIAVYQQFECVVNGSTAHPVIPVFHVYVERFGVEVIVPLVNFFQDSESFGRFSQAGLFQLSGKNIEYLLDDFLFVAMG
jgi:hypothetical protein